MTPRAWKGTHLSSNSMATLLKSLQEANEAECVGMGYGLLSRYIWVGVGGWKIKFSFGYIG